ncbi:hypothetical protein C8F01DRAFT_997391 [Mycena amicta]|nr:hypothetical protein C8F01DRAFT_997391 [Mycena amicta]
MTLVTGMSAEILEPYSRKLLIGLIQRGVPVISYACDGTEVERAIERLLCKNADNTLKYQVPAPAGGGSSFDILFAIYHGQAVAMLQDSKHSAKTFRNNLFSGTHLLTIGNHTAFYAQIHALAKLKGSPLFMRDVEKVDRQDDNAATRLFSADTLQFLTDNHPEWTGTSIYLFLLGEVVDAYQSRVISLHERLTMILRAHYFLKIWMDYLKAARYSPRNRFFISRECVDILHFLITGYIALLIIHRDHLQALTPFLPWLHSSEPCEHTFGIARKIIKDFTYWDFLHMAPKLRLTLRRAVLKDRVSLGKSRASGYNITYYQTRGIDALLMARFPSQDEIQAIVNTAYSEAEQLAVMAGIDVDRTRDLLNRDHGDVDALESWFSLKAFDAGIKMNGDDGMASEEEIDDEDDTSEPQLSDLIREAQTGRFAMAASAAEHQKLETLACAGASLMLDSMQKMQDFVSVERAADDEEILVEECQEVQRFARAIIAPLSIPDVNLTPGLYGAFEKQLSDSRFLDITHMIALRRQHQTSQAATGMKKRDQQAINSPRTKISRALNDVLRLYLTKGSTSGEERKLRTKAMSATSPTNNLTGNSKNALVVSTQNAKSVSLRFSLRRI